MESNWVFTSDSINEYAEVTARAIEYGAKPVELVSMAIALPTTKWYKHTNVVAIGVTNGELIVHIDSIPKSIPVLTLSELRKKYPYSTE